MFKRFIEIMDSCNCLAGSSVVVAAADEESVAAVRLAMVRGVGHATLVGDENVILPADRKSVV